MSTIQDTDLLLVNRGGVDYKLTASDLQDGVANDADLLLLNRSGTDYAVSATKIEDLTNDTDLLVISRAGVDCKVQAKHLKDYLKPQAPAVMPWIGHNGGIWHVKNADGEVKLGSGPYQAWNIDGTDIGKISSFNKNMNVVIVTKPDAKGLFNLNSAGAYGDRRVNWNFGDQTDTRKVTSMRQLFVYCESFNGALGGIWDTSNVTNMYEMFWHAEHFNQDISSWDTSNVTDMRWMFEFAEEFNQDLSDWCVSRFASEPDGFRDDAKAWTKDKPCWGNCPRGENGTVDPCPGGGGLPWQGHHGGIWHVKNASSSTDLKGGPYTAWNLDGTNERKISSFPKNTELVFITSPDCGELFADNHGTWNFGAHTDTSSVTNMSKMFYYCLYFNGDISGWDTSNVTNMKEMFSHAKLFNRNINSWNTSNVSDMSGMFEWADVFNKPIGNWDTSNVTSMEAMFSEAHEFNQDIGRWNTAKVTSMLSTFNYSITFNQDISGWNTAKVTNMDMMFRNCYEFNSDLSEWCVSNFTRAPRAFDSSTVAWTLPRPVWRTCPRGENKR